MSSTTFSPSVGRAEARFREALERLKIGKPIRVPRGSKISQNNVAKEAGVDPSALRRSRFPALVDEIQQWIASYGSAPPNPTPRQQVLAGRSRNRDLRKQIEDLKLQRDDALSKLVDAESRILYLALENERLLALGPKTNVAPLRPAYSRK